MSKDGGMPEGMRSIIGWTLGVGIIAFVLLILVIIFGNLQGNVGFTQDSIVITVINESAFTNPVHVNLTDYTLIGFNTSWSGITITELLNSTNGGIDADWNFTLAITDATISSLGVMTNATSTEYDNVSVSYTYSYSFDSQGQIDSDNIILNYTRSATNTAAQFPTVGTIVGIALLLLILIALLIFAIRRMMGVASESGGNTNASFG